MSFKKKIQRYFDSVLKDKYEIIEHKIPDAIFVILILPEWYYFSCRELAENVPDAEVHSISAKSGKYHVTLTNKK